MPQEQITWEQKFAAIKAVCEYGDANLQMRKPGDWYVHAKADLVQYGSIMSGSCGGDGSSPQEAVEAAWGRMTRPGYHIVVFASNANKRRHVRWNGFMWEQVAEDLEEK
jgi:hypothetical protein